MAERTVELESEETLEEVKQRAARAEAELERLRHEHTPTPPADATGSPGNASKQPPTPSTAAHASTTVNAPRERGSADAGGEEELRKDPMMAGLLDALGRGEDVGHYGRLVFAMVSRHFLPHDEVLARLTNDRDFSEEQARLMLQQVDNRDYNPPRRERLLEWQKEQSFQFMDVNDPDSGNLYRNLKFPDEVYQHIGGYQEAKSESV